MKKLLLAVLFMVSATESYGAAQDFTAVKVPGPLYYATVVTWSALLTGNTGTPVQNPSYRERTIQVTGTFGGATIVMEGSNDGTNWVTLMDQAGTPAAVSFTSAGMKKIGVITRYIRPSVSGGAAAAINAVLLLAK